MMRHRKAVPQHLHAGWLVNGLGLSYVLPQLSVCVRRSTLTV